MRSNTKAFTLVEVLVIITVIAVLMALLLPSLRQARWVAQRAICGTRLHHFGHALHTYANEHEGLLPPASVDQSTGGHVTFSMDPAMRDLLINQYFLPYKTMMCPTLQDTGDGFWGFLEGYEVWRIGYSITTGYDPYPWPYDGEFGFPNPVPSSAMRVSDPPGKVMLADSNLRANGKPGGGVWGRLDWATRYTSHRPNDRPEPEGGHTAFLDGHVKWFWADEMGPDGAGIHTHFGNYDYGFGFGWGVGGRDTFWGVNP